MRRLIRYLLHRGRASAVVALVVAFLIAPESIPAAPLTAVRVTPSVGGLHSEIYVRYAGLGANGPGSEPGGDIVTLTGPAGAGFACRHPLIHQHYVYELGTGTITLEIGPGAHHYPPDTGYSTGTRFHISIPILTRAWCPGRYHGAVGNSAGGEINNSPFVSYGTFTFRIASPAKHRSR